MLRSDIKLPNTLHLNQTYLVHTGKLRICPHHCLKSRIPLGLPKLRGGLPVLPTGLRQAGARLTQRQRPRPVCTPDLMIWTHSMLAKLKPNGLGRKGSLKTVTPSRFGSAATIKCPGQ
jgi:hypothetical protein